MLRNDLGVAGHGSFSAAAHQCVTKLIEAAENRKRVVSDIGHFDHSGHIRIAVFDSNHIRTCFGNLFSHIQINVIYGALGDSIHILREPHPHRKYSPVY